MANHCRNIRIFLSSTFTDLMDERDELMSKTFPVLRKIAFEHNVTLTELDLRWGITEEESRKGNVIDICLKEIDKSIPFFIGIVGGRYGWIPTLTNYNPFFQCYTDKVRHYIDDRLSITEMEMQHGVLEHNTSEMHAYFYIKNCPETGTNEECEKLHNLKEQIKNSNYPYYYFSSVDELSQMIVEHFSKLIEKLFPISNRTQTDKTIEINLALEKKYSQTYVVRKAIHDKLDKWIDGNDRKTMVLIGPEGSGKSAIVVNWYKSLQNYHVLCVHIGEGDTECTINSANDTLYKITTVIPNFNIYYDITTLSNHFKGIPENMLQSIYDSMREIKGKVLIIFDGINRLREDRKTVLSWMREPPSNAHVLLTTTSNAPLIEVFNEKNYDKLEIPIISNEECEDIIQQFFSIYAKKLSDKQVKRIAVDDKIKNLHILYLVLNELVCYGYFDGIDDYIDYLLGYDNIEAFYDMLLNGLIKRYATSEHNKLMEILSVIFIMDGEISEYDLLAITKTPPLIWTQMSASLTNALAVYDNKMTFTDQYFKKACYRKFFVKNPLYEKSIRKKIVEYYKRMQVVHYYKQLCLQYYALGDDRALYEVLTIPEVILQYYTDYQPVVCCWWKYLLNKGYDIVKKIEEIGDTTNNYKHKEIFYYTAIFIVWCVPSVFKHSELPLRCIRKNEEVINVMARKNEMDELTVLEKNLILYHWALLVCGKNEDYEMETFYSKKIISLYEAEIEKHKEPAKQHHPHQKKKRNRIIRAEQYKRKVFLETNVTVYGAALYSLANLLEKKEEYVEAMVYFNKLVNFKTYYFSGKKEVDYWVYEAMFRISSKTEEPQEHILDYAIKALQICKKKFGVESVNTLGVVASLLGTLDKYLQVKPAWIYKLQPYMSLVDFKIDNYYDEIEDLIINKDSLTSYFADNNDVYQWIISHWKELYDDDFEMMPENTQICDVNLTNVYKHELFIARLWHALKLCPFTSSLMEPLPLYFFQTDDDKCLDFVDHLFHMDQPFSYYVARLIVAMLSSNIYNEGYRCYAVRKILELARCEIKKGYSD